MSFFNRLGKTRFLSKTAFKGLVFQCLWDRTKHPDLHKLLCINFENECVNERLKIIFGFLPKCLLTFRMSSQCTEGEWNEILTHFVAMRKSHKSLT